nr:MULTISPECIES: hypothetical protein [unclassified Burkholderia]
MDKCLGLSIWMRGSQTSDLLVEVGIEALGEHDLRQDRPLNLAAKPSLVGDGMTEHQGVQKALDLPRIATRTLAEDLGHMRTDHQRLVNFRRYRALHGILDRLPIQTTALPRPPHILASRLQQRLEGLALRSQCILGQ